MQFLIIILILFDYFYIIFILCRVLLYKFIYDDFNKDIIIYLNINFFIEYLIIKDMFFYVYHTIWEINLNSVKLRLLV